MLPVLHGAPGASPGEAVLEEETVEEVALHNLIGEGTGTVGIGNGSGRLYDATAIAPFTDVRVVEGIDVDSHPSGVLGELPGAGDATEAEAGGIVVAHRLFVDSLIIVDETDALDGVTLPIELAEDVEQILGNGLVAHHLAHMLSPLGVDMGEAQVAQLRSRHGTVAGIGTALHALEDGIGDGRRREGLRQEQ